MYRCKTFKVESATITHISYFDLEFSSKDKQGFFGVLNPGNHKSYHEGHHAHDHHHHIYNHHQYHSHPHHQDQGLQPVWIESQDVEVDRIMMTAVQVTA